MFLNFKGLCSPSPLECFTVLLSQLQNLSTDQILGRPIHPDCKMNSKEQVDSVLFKRSFLEVGSYICYG